MNNLKEYRLEYGYIHQTIFAEHINRQGIDGPMISRFECGHALPTPEVAERIARILNRTVRDIWPDYPGLDRVQAPPPLKASCAFANASDAMKYGFVTQYIPIGKKSAVSWEMLHDLTMLRERQIRELIEDARNDGHIILHDGRGYYIPHDEPTEDEHRDILHSFYRDMKIVNKIIQRNAPLRRYVNQHSGPEGQLGICLRCGEPAAGDYCEPCEDQIKRTAALVRAQAAAKK